MKKIYLLILAFPFFGARLRAQVSLVKPLALSQYIAKVGSKLLFFAPVAADPGDLELWSSDGTAAGTQLVNDIWPGPNPGVIPQSQWDAGANSYRPIVYNNALYFVGEDPLHNGIWKSDGTAAGTNVLNPPGIEFDQTAVHELPYFCIFNGLLYFTEYVNHLGVELWRTDGTSAGTTLVKDISTANFFGSFPSHLIVFNGALYFTALDDNDGVEVFKSDGTAAGTAVLKDWFPGPLGSLDDGFGGSMNPYFTVSGNYLYYIAKDDSVTNNLGLFRTDGTAAGTILLSDHLLANELTDVNGTLMFYADDYSDIFGYGLFKSDGTPAGTVKIPLPANTVYYPGSTQLNRTFYSFNGNLYFPAGKDHGSIDSFGLWRTDGTTAGTSLVDPLGPPNSGGQGPFYKRDGTNNSFFFEDVIQIKGSSFDRRMIQSDGSPNGFMIYHGVTAYPGSAFLNGDLYFVGGDTTVNVNGLGLYKLTPSLVSGPLPVHWLAFDAALKENNSVDLSWQTAEETNNKGYFVERSTDGVQYTSLQWVPGAGTSSQTHTYAWIDDQPVIGTDYYRIQQVDLDNKSSYSAIRTVHPVAKNALSVTPNPVSGNTLVIRHNLVSGAARLQITDMSGRTVLSQVYTLNGSLLSCNIGSLKAGVYLMTLTADNQGQRTCLFVKE